MKLATRVQSDDPIADEDPSWRDRAAQLRLAGLADRLIVLAPGAPEEEGALLAPTLDHVTGPLFRLAPGCFAALAPDPEAVLAALPPGARLEEIGPPADPAGADIAMLGPLTEAATRGGGPRMIIDADFAIETAARTSKAIAAAVADIARQRGRAQAVRTSADIAARKRVAKRLEGLEATADALRAESGARLDALGAALTDLTDALEAEREDARARAAQNAERVDEMTAAVARIAAASQTGGPELAQEREGLARLATEIHAMLRRLDERIERLAETVAQAQSAPAALEALEHRLTARIDAAIARKDERRAAAAAALAEFLAIQTRLAEGGRE